MRTPSGITFRSSEIIRLDRVRMTAVVSHSQSVHSRSGNCKCRTHTKHQYEGRVSLIIPLYRRSTGEFVFILVTSLQILECRQTGIPPFVTAFVVIVCTAQRINLLITCCTGFVYSNFSTFLPLNWFLNSSVSAFMPRPAVSLMERIEIPFE